MKKKIQTRLVIFNENFWDKGLIYTQNILPLKIAAKNSCYYSIEIIAFISFLDFFIFWRKIYAFKKEQKKESIGVRIFPTLYLPSKFFYPKWFVLPFLLFNLFLYIIVLRISDVFVNEKLYYNLRSYQIALAFNLFYGNKHRIIFDSRTDMINEMVAIGIWRRNSISYNLWRYFEKRILTKSYKTIFISYPMKDDILNQCGLDDDENKFWVYNNQADFNRFSASEVKKNNIFLYTGSLGNWNNLRNYLIFFKKINGFIQDSELYIVTNTKPSKYESILNGTEFDSIRKKITVFKNPSYEKIPIIYSKCSYGLQLMSHKDSRTGVKFVEYVAAGLIPIVNENVRGAANFIKIHSVGFIVDNRYDNIDTTFCINLLNKKNSNFNISHNIKELLDVNVSYKLLYKIFN